MNLPRARHDRVFALIGVLALMIAWPLCARGETRETPTIGLRIEWTTTGTEPWRSDWRLPNGRIERFRSLGTGADDAGSVWLDSQGPLDSTIQLLVPTTRGSGTAHFHLKLKEIWQRPREISVGPTEKVRIGRVPGDALRCVIDRPHLIYRPGETWQARLQVNVVKLRRRIISGTLNWQLRAVQNPRVLASGAFPIETATNQSTPLEFPVSFAAPESEGVYELQLSLAGRGLDAIETRVQFVVLADQAPASTNGPLPGGTLVDSIDPEHAPATRRVASWSGLVSPDRKGVFAFPWRKPSPLEAEAKSLDTRSNWTAYRLKLPHPQRPHRLVVTVADGLPQEIGVALAPADVQPERLRKGLDAAVSLTRNSRTEPDTTGGVNCEWLCWPGETDAVVIIYGLQSEQPAKVRQIRVYELDDHLPAAGAITQKTLASVDSQRLVGSYLSKPSLLRAVAGAAPGPGLDDWESRLQAAERLAEVLRFQGENALLLAVAADGSAIYPSSLLEPSALYDSGELTAEGQDPRRKDILELLFRICDRSGLVLVPELQFQSPLPELERMLRENGAGAEGLLLKDSSGRTFAGTSKMGATARYNVLDPRVQQAIRNVVHELTERYRHHPSFRGVALELNRQGCLQLPGLEWGCDSATLGRFLHGAELPIPSDNAMDGHPQLKLPTDVIAKARPQWMAWRCREIARFHRVLATDIASAKPGSVAYLSGKRIVDNEAGEGPSRSIRTVAATRELLHECGLDFSLYSEKDPIVMLHPAGSPAVGASAQRLSIERVGYTIPSLETIARARHGHVVHRAPQRIELRGAPRPLGPDPVAILNPSMVVPGASLRQTYTSALASADAVAVFEGTHDFSVWRDDSLRNVRQSVAMLPAVPFHNALPQLLQPLIVRSASRQGKTYFYAVNEADLPLRVNLQLACAPAVRAQRLGNPGQIELSGAEEGASQLTFDLGSHDLWCACLESTDVKVIHAAIAPRPEGLTRLRERIDGLQASLVAWEKSMTDEAALPQNPRFEDGDADAGAPPGWHLPAGETSGWKLDNRQPHTGRWSLRLNGGGNGPRLRSAPLLVDNKRPISATVWLRASQPEAKVNLSWHVEGESRAQQTQVLVGAEWESYAAKASRLPAGRKARFIVEPLDECQVWIDDVHFQTSRHTQHELRQSTKMLSALNLAWEEHRYSDCQRMLDGHWGRLLQEQSPLATPPARQKIRFAERTDLPLHR